MELNRTLERILVAKGYEAHFANFLDFLPEQRFDRIIMNPPFEDSQDIEHVQHAYELLISFFDSPSLAKGTFAPGEFLQFQTELVGVRADGSYVDLGVGVTWKSNVETDTTGSAFLYNPDGIPDGIGVTGSVFDVQIVPEPPSIVLAYIGVVSLLMNSPLCRGRNLK